MPGERPLLPDALALTFNSIVLAAAEATGLAPGAGEEWVQALETHVRFYGPLSKFAVLYVPIQPPPAFWDYSCGRCRFWKEPAPGEALGACTLVSGLIARGGWCAIWMPPKGTAPFTWLPRILEDAPRWLAEAPEAFRNWPDAEQPPKELWMPGGAT
jgi:hypothetical protein